VTGAAGGRRAGTIAAVAIAAVAIADSLEPA
jgi:hypothetical protein